MMQSKTSVAHRCPRLEPAIFRPRLILENFECYPKWPTQKHREKPAFLFDPDKET